jgi:hypothetical protein
MNFNLDNATENTISINDSNNGFTKVNISKDNSNYNDINRLNNIELRKPNLGVSNKMDSNIGLDLLMNNNKKKKDNFNSGRPYRQNDNLSNYSDSESNSMSFEGEGSGGGSGLNFRNSGDMNNEEGFDEDDDISGEDEDDETLSNNSDDNKNYKQDYERMMEEKKELLFQFEKLEKKGIRLNKKFTISY